jgi:hypothetical protein
VGKGGDPRRDLPSPLLLSRSAAHLVFLF